jgi:hypothetical protein
VGNVARGSCALALALLPLGACSLLVNSDGLAEGPPSGLVDGAIETGVESAAPEAAPTLDASTDAGTDASGPFCPQPGAVLCSDFDEPSAFLPGSWDAVNNTNATMELTTSRFRSPPRSLVLRSVVAASAALDKAITGVKGAELAFDLYIETRGSNLSVAWFEAPGVGEVYLQPSDDTTTALLEHHQVGAQDVYDSTNAPPIATGGWHRVTLDVDFPTTLAIVKVDGAELLRRTVLPAWSTVTAAKIRLGVPASTGTSLFYDNVTIKTR